VLASVPLTIPDISTLRLPSCRPTPERINQSLWVKIFLTSMLATDESCISRYSGLNNRGMRPHLKVYTTSRISQSLLVRLQQLDNCWCSTAWDLEAQPLAVFYWCVCVHARVRVLWSESARTVFTNPTQHHQLLQITSFVCASVCVSPSF
jgi:hypothetical protein